MKRLLVFGGATEGRQLALRLAAGGCDVTLCVATPYGEALLPPGTRELQVRVGRLDAAAMQGLMLQGGFAAAVDATHPYAAEASRNIRAAAGAAGVPYYRLLRAASDVQGACAGCREFPSLSGAVQWLENATGNVLAATGAKELDIYTTLPDFAARVYPRVLPTEESVRRCAELGFLQSHVVAMQGPFSEELNTALLRQFQIRWLVTKDGGVAGVFAEKCRAARAVGAQVLVVRRPPEAEGGMEFDELLGMFV